MNRDYTLEETKNKTVRFDFDSVKEVHAFIKGINYINDTSVVIDGVECAPNGGYTVVIFDQEA